MQCYAVFIYYAAFFCNIVAKMHSIVHSIKQKKQPYGCFTILYVSLNAYCCIA